MTRSRLQGMYGHPLCHRIPSQTAHTGTVHGADDSAVLDGTMPRYRYHAVRSPSRLLSTVCFRKHLAIKEERSLVGDICLSAPETRYETRV